MKSRLLVIMSIALTFLGSVYQTTSAENSAHEPLAFKGITLGESRSAHASIAGLSCSGERCDVVYADYSSSETIANMRGFGGDPTDSTIGGYPLTRMTLYYDRGTLDSLEFLLPEKGASNVVESLTQKYGPPSSTEPTTSAMAPYAQNNIEWTWNIGKSSIHLTLAAGTVFVLGRPMAPENVAFHLTSVRYLSPHFLEAGRARRDAARRDL